MKGVFPKMWVASRLENVVTARKGKKPAILRNTQADDFVPYLDIHAIEKNEVRQFAEVKSSKIADKGDLFVVWDGARSGWVGTGITGAIGSTIMALTPRQIKSSYLRYFIASQFQTINTNVRGTGIPHVDPEVFWKLEVPIAPLAEQVRIVTKLEELLGKVEASQKRLVKIQVVLKRFRQSVLAAACSGRLTADWRKEHPDVESAAEFVNRVQEERKATYERQYAETSKNGQRKPKRPKNEFVAVVDSDADGLPTNWCVSRIGDISECLDYLRIPINKTERLSRQGKIPYYGANGQVGWINDFLFDEELVLVVEDETFIGREIPFSYVIRGKSWVNNHAHVLRPLGKMLVDYLNVCLSYYDFTPLTSGTTGRRKLNQEALIEAPLRIAPLSEQQEIVRRVESLFVLADQLESRCKKAQTFVNKLTPSLLAKAFRGELVPQDPKDEPADVLLQKIRKETPSKKMRVKNERLQLKA